LSFAFPKYERLLKRRDFLDVSGCGLKSHSRYFLIIKKEVGSGSVKIGITVSRKVGNAVVRNRLKRYVREFYRLHKTLFAPAYYTIIAKRGADELDFHQVTRELVAVMGRIHT
jgi:ribonuclease P protein component